MKYGHHVSPFSLLLGWRFWRMVLNNFRMPKQSRSKVECHSNFDILSKLMIWDAIKLYCRYANFYKNSEQGCWLFIRLKSKIKLEYEVWPGYRFYLGQSNGLLASKILLWLASPYTSFEILTTHRLIPTCGITLSILALAVANPVIHCLPWPVLTYWHITCR